jgi:dCTP deaminase
MSAVPKDQEPELFASPDGPAPDSDFGHRFGLLARQKIRLMLHREMIRASEPVIESQIQPASLDLRLGGRAWRVRASFLPGKMRSVSQQLAELKYDEISLEEGAVLERGCVYVVPLLEFLNLPDSFTAVANPKSSTGRLDIFTRLITDHCEAFDQVSAGYKGPLFAEISPRSFSVRVRKGTRLNQIRFRRRHSAQLRLTDFTLSDKALREWHDTRCKLVEGEPHIRNGLNLRVALSRSMLGDQVGYRAQKHADVIDVDRIAAYDIRDFWEPIWARDDRRLILDPDEFYILASHEKLQIPPELAAEMVPIDPSMGEFRVHYAGFFDPGFGMTQTGEPGSRGVLEVRSHEVPFVLEDGQIIGRLVYEEMADQPEQLYGSTTVSNYQGQGLKLSKHFRM